MVTHYGEDITPHRLGFSLLLIVAVSRAFLPLVWRRSAPNGAYDTVLEPVDATFGVTAYIQDIIRRDFELFPAGPEGFIDEEPIGVSQGLQHVQEEGLHHIAGLLNIGVKLLLATAEAQASPVTAYPGQRNLQHKPQDKDTDHVLKAHGGFEQEVGLRECPWRQLGAGNGLSIRISQFDSGLVVLDTHPLDLRDVLAGGVLKAGVHACAALLISESGADESVRLLLGKMIALPVQVDILLPDWGRRLGTLGLGLFGCGLFILGAVLIFIRIGCIAGGGDVLLRLGG